MLMAVKNQIKISILSIKYSIMREMLNKATFISNVVFMMLNNASMIIQWVILYSIKDNFGGYQFKDVLLLWGMASSAFGFSHFLFKKAFSLSDVINTGKLDAFLVQPKSVLISAITTDVSPSSLGDLLYGFIMLFISGFTIQKFFLFIFFVITAGLIITSYSIILNSLSFWFKKSDVIADKGISAMINFSTYPDGIFKGIAKILLFTLIPVGISNYIPVRVMIHFDIYSTLLVILVTILSIELAFIVFYRGLKRYSSSSLMIART